MRPVSRQSVEFPVSCASKRKPRLPWFRFLFERDSTRRHIDMQHTIASTWLALEEKQKERSGERSGFPRDGGEALRVHERVPRRLFRPDCHMFT